MRKISFRLIYNRKKRLNKQGKALIQVEAYLEKRKVYFSTHIYIYPEQWDSKRMLIVSHPQAEGLNRMIDEFILHLQSKELEYWKQGKTISLSLLKKETGEKHTESSGFLSFSRKWVEQSLRKETTKLNLNTTLDILQTFRSSLGFEDLTYHFLLEFENYLKERKYSINTVAKHMKHLRTFTNEAIRQGYLSYDNYPFRNYRMKTIEGKHVFLLPSEIQKLESLTLPEKYKSLQHTLDAFLFCCYTGLRYSDFTSLSSKNLVMMDGHLWLTFHSQKTDVKITLPLYLLFQGKAIAILNKYKPHLELLFHLHANSTINKELDRLRVLAHLDKHFSFHTARHTHATLLIYKGVKITTVQKLLGHRSIKTTEVYSEIFSGTIVKDLQQCEF